MVDQAIPGPAPVSAHSVFASVPEAAEAGVLGPGGHVPLGLPSHVELASLDGLWGRVALSEDPPRHGSAPDLRGLEWQRVMVPDNFGLEPTLSAHFGPVFYRRRLAPLASPHSRLVLNGVDYLADVWLDGDHLGHHEGYFAPFGFDVTGRVERGSVLTVRVQDPFEDLADDKNIFAHAKRVIKGTLKYHDSRPGGLPGNDLTRGWTARTGQSMSTGGITGRVALSGSGPVRIEAAFVTPLDPGAGLVHVACVFDNLSGKSLDATVVLSFPTTQARDQRALRCRLPAGSSRVDLRSALPDAEGWWPCSHLDLGRPALHDLRTTVVVDGRVSDERVERFGLRTAVVRGEPKRFAMNGRDVFVQAANYIPRQHFAGVDAAFYRRDMEMAASAHLNSLGVHAHVQAPECYVAADEAGVLLFQDFPLQWRYDSGEETNPGFVDKARRQIAEMAYALWNHPSVVYWACHNEPNAMFFPGLEPDPAEDMDNQVLDAALETTLRQIEPDPDHGGRHVHRASGVGEDLHLYDGSLSGGDVYGCRRHSSWFVSEFGFWTVGPRAWRWGDAGWPPDQEDMAEWLSRLSFGPSTMSYAGLPDRYPSLRAWQEATEAYGAFLAKYQCEWIRLNRGDPFSAYRWHFFADWWGWAGGGLVDVERRAKGTYSALRSASRPLLVATSLPFSVTTSGAPLEFEVSGVNERRSACELEVRWQWMRWPETLVVGVDEDAQHALGAVDAVTPDAMVALPRNWHSPLMPAPALHDPELVEASGVLNGTVPPEAAARLGTVELRAPSSGLSGATFGMWWTDRGHQESNWFHVLGAPEGWFCGPGAWVVQEGGVKRLGTARDGRLSSRW